MKSLKMELVAVLCCLSNVSGLNDHVADGSYLGPDKLRKRRDASEFQESFTRVLIDEGYSTDYLNGISDGDVHFEAGSDERDLFVRRVCNLIEGLFSDGTYSCECSMQPRAPQVSYTCERQAAKQSGRATYGVRYQGSFIFRYLALSFATPASVCLTDMTYGSADLNGGRGGLLPFGDICIDSQLEIDVNPLRGDVEVSVDSCNVQLGDNLGMCTFCGPCPDGPGFYVDCSNIWPVAFCVPNDIPLIGGILSNGDAGAQADTQGIGGGPFGGGLANAVGLPNPEKLFNALDMTRLMQEKIKSVLADRGTSQGATTSSQKPADNYDDYIGIGQDEDEDESWSTKQASSIHSGSKKVSEKDAKEDKKSIGMKDDAAERANSYRGKEEITAFKSQKKDKKNKKLSWDKHKAKGGKDFSGPSNNEHLYEETISMQPKATIEKSQSNKFASSKKRDKGKKTYLSNKDNRDGPMDDAILTESSNQQQQQYDEDIHGKPVESPGIQLNTNPDPPKEFGSWFKGFLRKSG